MADHTWPWLALSFFGVPEGRKSIKNRPKIVSHRILNEESKRTSRNGSERAQHGSKIGPSWGHVGLQNRLGPVQERTRKDTQDEAEKNTQKERKKNLTDNEREARLHVTT